MTTAFPASPPGSSFPPEERRRTSGWAIASLVSGLLGCVPFVTGLVAIVTGIIGIRQTRHPGIGGRGLATAGLVLGIISVVAWGLLVPSAGAGFFLLARSTEVQRQLAKDFVHDLAGGEIDSAQARTTGTSLSRSELEQLSAAMAEYGDYKDLTGNNVALNTQNGVSTFDYSGTATFEKGVKQFKVAEVKTAEGWKITDFELSD